MEKKWIFNLVDKILLIIFLIVGITGIIIFPDFLNIFGLNINDLPKVELYKYHNWFGLLLLIYTTIHIIIYRIFIINSLKKLIIRDNTFKKTKFKSNKYNSILNLLLIISFVLISITGVIKYPGFLSYIKINITSMPLNLITIIHNYFGIMTFVITIIHILLQIKK